MCRFVVAFFSLGLLFLPAGVQAANANLFIDVLDSDTDTEFGGAQVVEVVIIDADKKDTDKPVGEPDVTANGKDIRMAQSDDGDWYGYIADDMEAQDADEAEDPDFGVFCSRTTATGVLGDGSTVGNGLGFNDTNGVAVARIGSLQGWSNGVEAFNACTGTPGATLLLNEAVTDPPDLNTFGSLPIGQIGVDLNVWPLVQLYNFNVGVNVVIQYSKGGGTQTQTLAYVETPPDPPDPGDDDGTGDGGDSGADTGGDSGAESGVDSETESAGNTESNSENGGDSNAAGGCSLLR